MRPTNSLQHNIIQRIIIPYRFSIYIPEEQCETLGIKFKKKNSVTEALTDVRYRMNINNIEYCIDDLSSGRKNIIKSEFKSKLKKRCLI